MSGSIPNNIICSRCGQIIEDDTAHIPRLIDDGISVHHDGGEGCTIMRGINGHMPPITYHNKLPDTLLGRPIIYKNFLEGDE